MFQDHLSILKTQLLEKLHLGFGDISKVIPLGKISLVSTAITMAMQPGSFEKSAKNISTMKELYPGSVGNVGLTKHINANSTFLGPGGLAK